jgi:hypothetical protein
MTLAILAVAAAILAAAVPVAYAQRAPAASSQPIMPDKDPASDGPAVKFLEKIAGQHPRMLMTAEKLTQLRAFYNSPEGKGYHDQIEGYVASCKVPANRKTDDAWGQEVGLFNMPMVAIHYVLTKDKASFEKSVAYLKWLAGTANWTRGGEPAVDDTPEAYAAVLEKMKQMGPQGERNSDTTASFTMVGASLMWDWLYNDLDPAFREQFRQVLWQHARAMYYGGHLAKNPGGGYWRGVPAYNHRWFRDWGLALAAMAAAEGKPEEQWLLGKVEAELKFMADWLPADGSQHEGPSYGASAGGLGMAMQASDECVGTHYLDNPFFLNVSSYAMQVSAPGMKEALYFSDCPTTCLSVHPFFLKTASDHKQTDVLDGIRQILKVNASKWGVRDYTWLALLCDDPKVTGGQFAKLPTTTFLSDLGIAVARDSWQDRAVAAMFRCGPPGGYKANAWRPTKKDERGNLAYLTVAHDQPNANSFILLGDGEYLAETDRYCENPGKLSSSQNTILVGGFGQIPEGRPEGEDWLQPGNGDMTKMGVITAWKDAGDVMVVEGEAAGSYLAYTDAKTKKSRPALDRFRRTFIWVKGGYVLVLDDVRAPQPTEITWLMQGAKLDTVDEASGRYRLSKGQAQCEFQLVADAPFKAKMGVSTANDHSKLLGWQQLQVGAETAAIRFVSAYDPWHHKDLKVKFTPDGADKATVTVESAGFTDTWQWQAAKGQFEASTVHGSRKGGFDVTVDAKSVPPAAQ